MSLFAINGHIKNSLFTDQTAMSSPKKRPRYQNGREVIIIAAALTAQAARRDLAYSRNALSISLPSFVRIDSG